MKSITVRKQDGSEMVYATNTNGTGCFQRRPYEGAYRQTAGTAQTPIFKTAKQFRRWLGGVGRMIDSIGW